MCLSEEFISAYETAEVYIFMQTYLQKELQ